MKYPFLLLIAFTLAACSKEDEYGPMKLKHGQAVELLVGHRYGAIDDQLLLWPQKEPAPMPLFGFADREPGYIYRVKAKAHIDKTPPQDGPAYWFDFLEVIDKEKYEGNESFEIALIQSYIPGGPVIVLMKNVGQYHYIADILLTYANENKEVKDQLEEIWQNAKYVRENWQTDNIQSEIKWKSIKATVSHDPENYGKAYLVQHIEFVE